MSERKTIQHLRSTTLGVKPNVNDIKEGEISVNLAKGGEALMIKNTENEIVEFKSKEYVDNLVSQKQNTISDLETIRTNAAKGATALQSIPSEYVTESELESKGYLTSVPSEYITATQLQNKGYLTDIPSEYITESELNEKGLATVTYVNQEIGKIQNSPYDDTEIKNQLANKADKSELFSKSYNDLTDKPTIPSVDGLASEEFVREEIEAIDYVTAVDTVEEVDGVSNDFVTSEQLDARGYATTVSVNAEIDTINQTIGVNTSSFNLSERITKLEDGYGVPDARAKVLWVGTSIPSSVEYWGADNNYPRMVADVLGFELYNMSRPSSCLSKIVDPGWTTSAQYDAEPTVGRSLSMTKAEIDSTFRNTLNTIRRNEGLATSWVENLLNDWKSHSYEELIMPYIDGTIAECDTVVIDHGFNDRFNILNFCRNFNNPSKDNLSYYPADQVGGDTDYAYPVKNGNQGWYWLQHFGDTQYYDAHEYGRALWNGVETTPDFKNNYFGAMMFVVRKIWSVNPRIRIIIGNYFSQDYGLDEFSIYCTKYILEANIQLAKFCGLNCVNVYNYTALRNRPITLADGTQTTDMLIFCPDGVHPGSDLTGQSNKIIAGAYINAIRGTLYK